MKSIRTRRLEAYVSCLRHVNVGNECSSGVLLRICLNPVEGDVASVDERALCQRLEDIEVSLQRERLAALKSTHSNASAPTAARRESVDAARDSKVLSFLIRYR